MGWKNNFFYMIVGLVETNSETPLDDLKYYNANVHSLRYELLAQKPLF
jgi:hypothetical protein